MRVEWQQEKKAKRLFLQSKMNLLTFFLNGNKKKRENAFSCWVYAVYIQNEFINLFLGWQQDKKAKRLFFAGYMRFISKMNLLTFFLNKYVVRGGKGREKSLLREWMAR